MCPIDRGSLAVQNARSEDSTRPLGLVLLAAILCAGGVLRAWLSFHDDGIYWPDEIYQSLEPAHRLVFGYGLIAWEFVEGARNWSLPGLVAGLLKLCVWLRVEEPRQYLHVTRLFFSAIGVATAYASYRLARSQGAPTLEASCAAALFSLVAPAIYFGPRAMSETASALPVALGLAFALAPNPARWSHRLGISLLGAAVMLRLQNGIFCLGLLAILAARRNWRVLLDAAAVLAIWALIFGLLDKLTWGAWFHSAVTYVRANVLEHRSELWGTSSALYYPRILWRSMGGPAACVAGLALVAAARAPGLLLVSVAFVLLHSAIPHKELRFTLPALPIFAALAGMGLGILRSRLRPAIGWALVSLTLFFCVRSAVGFHQLTFGQLGHYEDLKPGASAYDDFGPVNRLLLAAHERPDLCGLKVEAVHLAWTGGFTYLHRPVPLYPHFGPPRHSGFYNYAITIARPMARQSVAASEGSFVLERLPVSTCLRDAGYRWLLP